MKIVAHARIKQGDVEVFLPTENSEWVLKHKVNPKVKKNILKEPDKVHKILLIADLRLKNDNSLDLVIRKKNDFLHTVPYKDYLTDSQQTTLDADEIKNFSVAFIYYLNDCKSVDENCSIEDVLCTLLEDCYLGRNGGEGEE